MTTTTHPVESPPLLASIHQLVGLGGALDTLKEHDCTLPGFTLARTLLERDLADLRSDLSGQIHREAARLGVDVGRVRSIRIDWQGGRPVIVVESFAPEELVDGAPEAPR